MTVREQYEQPSARSDQTQQSWQPVVDLSDPNNTVSGANAGHSNQELVRLGILPHVDVATDAPNPKQGPSPASNTFSNDILQATAKLNSEFGRFGDGIHDAWSAGQILEDQSFLPDNNKLNQGVINHRLQAMYDDGKPDWYEFWKHPQAPAYTADPGSRDKFFDDNAWIGIASMDNYNKTHSHEDLSRAKQIFDFEQTGLDGTDKMTNSGGLRWEKGNDFRSTVSTAGAAQLALQLYQADPKSPDAQKYLDFAKQQFDWVDKNLKAPDGLYSDGMNPDGTLHSQDSSKDHSAEWSYNQGLMLGDATMLYQITKDPKYLKDAQDTAQASLNKWGGPDAQGHNGFMSQNPFFNTVFFKNLMLLDQAAPDNAYRQALSSYARDVDTGMKSNNMLYPVSEQDRKDDHQALMQASAIQVLSLADQYPPS